MARKRPPLDDGQAADIDAEEARLERERIEEEGGAGALQLALEQLGESEPNGTILVHKMSTIGAQTDWAYLARVSVAAFDIEAIARQYGPGRYKFQFMNARGRNVRLIQFLIGGPAATPPPSHPLPAPPAPERRDLLEQFLVSTMDANTKLMAAIVSAVMGKGSGDALKATDLLEALKVGKSLSSEGSSVDDVLRLIQTGISLGQGGTVASAEDGDGNLAGLAGKAMSVIEAWLRRTPAPAGTSAAAPTSSVTAPATRPALAPAAPAAASAAASATDAGDARAGEATVMKLAQSFVPRLLREAEAGRRGWVFGAWVADHAAVAWKPHLLTIAKADELERMAMLTAIDARLAPHREFIDDAADGILDVLEPVEGDDDADRQPAPDDLATVGADTPAAGGAGDAGDGGDDGAADQGTRSRTPREGRRRATEL